MAGVATQAPTSHASSRASPGTNGSTALDYINGHGALPSSPVSNVAPPAPAIKKGKSKKAADPNETGKLLAAKINQLELDAAGDKEQEAEIGRSSPESPTPDRKYLLPCLRKHDLPPDKIAGV